MEALIIVIVIAALLLILGVSLDMMALGIMALVDLAAGLMLVFFAVCTFLLLISKRQNAEFVGIEDARGFDTAVYELESGERLGDIFPAENALRNLVYRKKHKRVSVCRLKKHKFVIDGHSALTILLGLLLSSLSFAGALVQTLNYFAEEGIFK